MDFDTAARHLHGVPMTKPDKGRELYDWVLHQRPEAILELGFAHGVSTCYMAAALDELGRGHITTIDKQHTRSIDPTIEQLSGDLCLSGYVTPIRVERSFTWELRRMIDAHAEPIFDFVFHDGGHTWDVAGFGFFLADRLLKPGGWMLFDDLKWSLGGSQNMRDRGWVKELSAEERDSAQVGEVFRLLVARHPDYIDLHRAREGNWGWARKRVDC